jgi:hypothetical protein
MLTFHICEFRRGNKQRVWTAHVLGVKIGATGSTKEGTRQEVAAQVLEKVAAEIRQDRHKAAVILSVTHGYNKGLKNGCEEIKVQAQALREMADDLERKWGLNENGPPK